MLVKDKLWLVASEYNEDYFYKFDETNYYYLLQPDHTIADQSVDGLKKTSLEVLLELPLTCPEPTRSYYGSLVLQ